MQKAFRKVSGKVHPDKGGSAEDSQRLNAARDAWQAALRGPPRGRPRPAAPAAAVVEPRGFRVQSEAVLLTYQSWTADESASMWERFCGFIRANAASWGVRHWTATMEANASGSRHLHLMLQFNKSVDCATSRFAFEAKQPNASSHDYLGEGVSTTSLAGHALSARTRSWANGQRRCGSNESSAQSSTRSTST